LGDMSGIILQYGKEERPKSKIITFGNIPSLQMKKKSTDKKVSAPVSKSSPSALKKMPAKEVKPRHGSARKPKPFPVVGIGASAGGLEAFSELLSFLPTNLNMAYIFVQHFSPSHENFLPQMISRKTTMPVHQVRNGMEVKKNNIYIIPPNKRLTITDGKLKLVSEHGKHNFFPIDLFMISLAKVYRNSAIGILLSGTGTDGTYGLKEIKLGGGITFAQDMEAKYPGMPLNAIEMGHVDFSLSLQEIATELSALVKHPITGLMNSAAYLANHVTDVEKIHALLLSKKNIDFGQYKQTTIYRRIMRRMLLNKLQSLPDYVNLLNINIKELLIRA
jgi:two-component system CheB/CheR fusion protein